MSTIRKHVRGNIVGYVALFFALGLGSAWAATELEKNEVKSKHIKNKAVKTTDLANNAVKSGQVADGSLLSEDFLNGELPPGEPGPPGPRGEPGPPGPSTGPAGGDLTGSYPDPQIASNAVGTAELSNFAVTTDKLGNSAVNGAKLANGAVTPSEFGTLPAARVQNLSAQPIPNNTTGTISYTSERFDNANMHNNAVNNDEVTVPIDGIYLITAGARWEANTAGSRYLAISVTGASRIEENWTVANGSHPTDQSLATVFQLDAGDRVDVEVNQNSGGELDIQARPELSVVWIAPG